MVRRKSSVFKRLFSEQGSISLEYALALGAVVTLVLTALPSALSLLELYLSNFND